MQSTNADNQYIMIFLFHFELFDRATLFQGFLWHLFLLVKSLGAKEVKRDYFLEKLEKVSMDKIEHRWIIDNNLI